MQKCPQCNSLVADDVEVCPSCRFDLEIHRAESSLSPNATVALSPIMLIRAPKAVRSEVIPIGLVPNAQDLSRWWPEDGAPIR